MSLLVLRERATLTLCLYSSQPLQNCVYFSDDHSTKNYYCFFPEFQSSVLQWKVRAVQVNISLNLLFILALYDLEERLNVPMYKVGHYNNYLLDVFHDLRCLDNTKQAIRTY